MALGESTWAFISYRSYVVGQGPVVEFARRKAQSITPGGLGLITTLAV
jgi:hypothetical protein